MLGKFCTAISSATVLPYNCRAVRFASFFTPCDDCLALVGYADRNDWLIQLTDDLLQSRQYCLPYLVGIMLNPTRLRKVLREFAI